MKRLTVKQTANVLGVSLWTVYRRIRDGHIPAIDVGRGSAKRPCWRIPEEGLRIFEKTRLSVNDKL